MGFSRTFDSQSQLRRSLVAFGLLFALVVSTFVPIIASAAQLNERSIELSSSSISTTDVSYTVNFTAVGAAAAFVVDFCSNTPTIEQACTAPAGMVVTGATSDTAGVTAVDDIAVNTLVVTKPIVAGAESVQIDGITNPSTAGAFYARVITYNDAGDAAAYLPTELGNNAVDQGSVSLYLYETIGVSGAVLESLTFCVAGETIPADCDLTGLDPATVRLGEQVGDLFALSPTALSTGSIHTQISTNASTGAVVSLKSNREGCGGLVRAGAPTSCEIEPALAGGITAGTAKFGVRTNTATDAVGAAAATGTYQPAATSAYNTLTYTLNYVDGDATGITSPFGDEFLDTADAPANNKNMELTFGASVSNDTPAGNYSADLSLVATGKF